MTYAHKFTPIRFRDGVPIVAAESHWRLPAKWGREAAWCGNPVCKTAASGRTDGRCACGLEVDRPLVLVDCDPFVEWDGPFVGFNSEIVYKFGEPVRWVTDSQVLQGIELAVCAEELTMSDIRRRIYAVIDATPNLDWVMFTEWPGKLTDAHLIICEKCGRNSRTTPNQKYCGNGSDKENGHNYQLSPRPNLFLGVDINTQREADERIPQLLKIPAAKRVVRVRPGEAVDVSKYLRCGGDCGTGDIKTGSIGCRYGKPCNDPPIDAIIVEGTDKPLHPDWVRSLRDQAIGAGVPFEFLGWGDWLPWRDEHMTKETFTFGMNHSNQLCRFSKLSGFENVYRKFENVEERDKFLFDECVAVLKVGRKHSGRVLDGRTWEGVTG